MPKTEITTFSISRTWAEQGLSRTDVQQAGMHMSGNVLSDLLWEWSHILLLLPAQSDKSTHFEPHGSFSHQEVTQWENPLAFTSGHVSLVQWSKISIHYNLYSQIIFDLLAVVFLFCSQQYLLMLNTLEKSSGAFCSLATCVRSCCFHQGWLFSMSTRKEV